MSQASESVTALLAAYDECDRARSIAETAVRAAEESLCAALDLPAKAHVYVAGGPWREIDGVIHAPLDEKWLPTGEVVHARHSEFAVTVGSATHVGIVEYTVTRYAVRPLSMESK